MTGIFSGPVASIILVAVLAASLSFLLTPVARRLALRVGAVDLPGPRKIHQFPIPRLGGLAVIASAVIVTLLLPLAGVPAGRRIDPMTALALGLGLVPILFVSIWDDIRPLPAIPKFVAQFAGAGIAVACGVTLGTQIHLFGIEVPLGPLVIPVSVLWIVGVTNAFNIVDGLDGLSAGLALISALSLAGVAVVAGRPGTTLSSIVLAAALLGFLPYNTFPARVFLGDAGAAAIGFWLACLALRGGSTLSAGMAVAVPVLVIGVPVAETLISMLRRFLRRVEASGRAAGLFEADRAHIHHRLLDLGITQRRAVWLLYGVGLILAASGLASLFLTASAAGLLLVTLLFAAAIGIRRLNYDEFAVVRRGVVLKVYDAPVLRRALFPVFFDLGLVGVSIYGAIVLKYDDWGLTTQRPLALALAGMFPAITLATFWLFQLYRGAWRQATAHDLIRCTSAVGVVTLLSALTGAIALRNPPPVTFFAAYGLLMLVFVNGSRASNRLIDDRSRRAASSGDRVLIYGAGMGGVMALREMLANREWLMRPVGFVDDDQTLSGRIVNGFNVYGSIDDVKRLLEANEVDGVVVASEKISTENLVRLEKTCRQGGAWVSRFRIGFEPI